MSTLTTIPPKTTVWPQVSATFPGDQRIVIRGVDADLYNRIDEAIGEGQHVHVAYDGRDLELMTTSDIHEWYKRLFERLVVS